jgi:signal transduction histidine kinase
MAPMQIDERRFTRLAIGSIGIGFLLIAVGFVSAIAGFVLHQRSSDRVDHTYQVVDKLAQVEILVERAATASRGYVIAPSARRLETFRANAAGIQPAIDIVANLTSDNANQRADVEALRSLAAEEIAVSRRMMALAVGGDLGRARALFAAEGEKQRIFRLREISARMRAREQSLLGERSEDERGSLVLSQLMLIATGVLLTILAIAVIMIVRRYTGALTDARDRLAILNTNLEGAVAERTADLVRANEEIQRFAYIVSHDLRSPLVNVLGFTAELEGANKAIGILLDKVEKEQPELVSDDARFAVREDLPEAIGFIRGATQKMDRLINAILHLSRQGRRVLNPELLRMDEVVGDIIDSLETLAANQEATIRIDGMLPDIFHDRLAIEQIFQNVIENAIKYRRPDVPGLISVSGRTEGDRALFDITDNGRGIAPEDLRRVFELFRRAGKQDVAGEGIGLAHVNSLVIRLGGIIDVRSTLGEGSTFTVKLPLQYKDKGE